MLNKYVKNPTPLGVLGRKFTPAWVRRAHPDIRGPTLDLFFVFDTLRISFVVFTSPSSNVLFLKTLIKSMAEVQFVLRT